jgi:hypothetical protein
LLNRLLSKKKNSILIRSSKRKRELPCIGNGLHRIGFGLTIR